MVVLVAIAASTTAAQQFPGPIKSYLDRNHKGWKLAGECYPTESENRRFLIGDFDGNGERDFVVKFIRGKKGFLMAFLANDRSWKPFYLPIYSADDAKFSDLMLFEKGDRYELGETDFKLTVDAPADFRCESDVGGIHVYRNGKFIGY